MSAMRNQKLGMAGLAAVALGATILPSTAYGHGGTTLAAGTRGSTSVRLQAADSTTPSGAEAVDLSAILAGAGTGDKATVTFWVRPSGRKTFRVRADRDATGIAHSDVALAGRGSWRDWDVSAVVRLSTGSQIRVTNDRADPPGPDPSSTKTATRESASGAARPAAAPATPEAIDDVTGKGPATPGWVVPSLIVIVMAAVGAAVVAARRRRAG